MENLPRKSTTSQRQSSKCLAKKAKQNSQYTPENDNMTLINKKKSSTKQEYLLRNQLSRQRDLTQIEI